MLLFVVYRQVEWQEMTDEELIVLYQQTEDLEVVGFLLQRHLPDIFPICKGYLDISDCQDLCMQLFQKLQSDLKHKKIHRFSHWIKVVTKRECLLFRRTKAYRQQQRIRWRKDTNPQYTTNPFLESSQVNDDAIFQALYQLPHCQRTCLELFFFKEKTYKEISNITGWSKKKVKSYLQNGKRRLRILLEGN